MKYDANKLGLRVFYGWCKLGKVRKKMRDEIESALKRAFMLEHPNCKEPHAYQLSLFHE